MKFVMKNGESHKDTLDDVGLFDEDELRVQALWVGIVVHCY